MKYFESLQAHCHVFTPLGRAVVLQSVAYSLEIGVQSLHPPREEPRAGFGTGKDGFEGGIGKPTKWDLSQNEYDHKISKYIIYTYATIRYAPLRP